MQEIPTRGKEKSPWGGYFNFITYKGNVLIIKINNNQKKATFQYDGTSCLQGVVRGRVFKKFKTTSKWFNPTWWYKKTCWSSDSNKIFFHTKNSLPDNLKKGYLSWESKKWERIYKYATNKGRPTDKILNTMLKLVQLKTGIKFELDFTDLAYNKHWSEARIPLKYKGEKYLLTWENCD